MKAKQDAPRVFVSYAEPDTPAAESLVGALKASRIECFFAPVSIPRGENIVLRISRGLEQSDFFLLLLSRHTVDRQWVELEWSAALALEIRKRRAFLFVLRLDETEPPAALAPGGPGGVAGSTVFRDATNLVAPGTQGEGPTAESILRDEAMDPPLQGPVLSRLFQSAFEHLQP